MKRETHRGGWTSGTRLPICKRDEIGSMDARQDGQNTDKIDTDKGRSAGPL
jgi:hypothetical protein